MKIGIFGAGAIGTYVGGRLTASGADVVMLGRKRLQSAIAKNGLKITHYALPEIELAARDVTYTTSPKKLSDCDVIIVTVKSSDSEAAAQELIPITKPDAVIISLQNGIGNAERIADVLTDHTVLPAMIPNNVNWIGPSHFHMGTEGQIALPDTLLMAELSQLMQKAGLDVGLHMDMRSVQWGKLLMNLSNAINTLGDVSIWDMLRDRSYRISLAMSIEEALSILTSAKITPAKIGKVNPKTIPFLLKLPDPIYHRIMPFIIKVDKQARSSMAQDMAAGKPQSEIDVLNGEVCNFARKVGQPSPINDWITAEIKAAFKAGKSPAYSGAEMLARLKALPRG